MNLEPNIEISTKKTKNISSFRKIYTYFQSFFSTQSLAEKNYLQSLIKNEDFESIVQVLNTGYILTKNLKFKIQQQINNNIKNILNTHELPTSNIKVSNKLKDEHILCSINLLLNYDFVISPSIWNDKFANYINQPIEQIIQDPINIFNWNIDTMNTLNTELKYLINKSQKILPSYNLNIINYVKENHFLFNNIINNLQEYLLESSHKKEFYLNIIENHLSYTLEHASRYVKSIQPTSKNIYEDILYFSEQYIEKNKNILFQLISPIDLNHLIEKLKKNYKKTPSFTDSYLKNVLSIYHSVKQKSVPQSSNVIKKYSTEDENFLILIKQLPEDLNKSLVSILNNYSNIKKHYHNDKNSITFLQVKKVYEETLPNIINLYLGLNQEDRISLLNVNGKTAHELTLDSLDKIDMTFKNTYQEIKENIITNISALNRLTNTKKNI